MHHLRICFVAVAFAFCVQGPAHALHDANADTWVVILSTSRFWYNYRHAANALSIYHTVKRLGVTDDRILLLMAQGFACDPRNCHPGSIFNDVQRSIDLYGTDVEVDYRGLDVSANSFIRLLTGRHPPNDHVSKRLRSGPKSRVLIYITGHGGENFFKFQDSEIISNRDISDAIEQMHQQHRYGEILFIADTCHAESLIADITSPNVIAVASSGRHEDSYSVELSREIGVYMIDCFTGRLLQFLEKISDTATGARNPSISTLFQFMNNPLVVRSHPKFLVSNFTRGLDSVTVRDFFGNWPRLTFYDDLVEVHNGATPITHTEFAKRGKQDFGLAPVPDERLSSHREAFQLSPVFISGCFAVFSLMVVGGFALAFG